MQVQSHWVWPFALVMPLAGFLFPGALCVCVCVCVAVQCGVVSGYARCCAGFFGAVRCCAMLCGVKLACRCLTALVRFFFRVSLRVLCDFGLAPTSHPTCGALPSKSGLVS